MFRKMAQDIARSTSEVIDKGVLVTDEEGVIVGCNDESRLGSFHVPSLKVMAENRPLVTTTEEAEKLDGVFAGYTLPIRLMDKIVGSISITGVPEEVERYGVLVQKQSELMLREQTFLQSSLLRERALRDLVENVASCDGNRDTESLVALQGRDLGFNLAHCRMGIEIMLEAWGSGTAEAAFQLLLREVKDVFSNPRNIIASQGDYRLSVLFAPGLVKRVDVSCEKLAETLLLELQARLGTNGGIAVRSACGYDGEGLAALGDSLRAARRLVRMAAKLGAGKVLSVYDHGGALLLDAMDGRERRAYAVRVLGGLPLRNDFEELRETFIAWCESPFRMAETAARLSMHRNSLQYRLKKIRLLTGKDPWNFREAFELWSAFVITKIERTGAE